MREILSGLWQWRVMWPDVWSLECYFLRTEQGSVIIDPIESADIGPISEADDIVAVIVTIGWHERSARLFGQRYGVPVYIPERDLCMIENLDEYETYGDGDILPGRLRSIGCPGLTRGEQALLSDVHDGVLFTGDCLGCTAKWAPNGVVLGGHPNGHPHPSKTLSHLLDHGFTHLCPGHGDPLIGCGRTELESLFASGRSTSTGAPRVSYFPLSPA